MSTTLANGLAHGKGAGTIARELYKNVSSLSRARAWTIARTEIINAHAEGQLDAFEKLGIEKVGAELEWSTAGDDIVCTKCEEMNGEVFTVEEARGMIPLHPNCRCAWIPYVSEAIENL
jgi:SPP1 gp7 family putative phage head morphogenesis protein